MKSVRFASILQGLRLIIFVFSSIQQRKLIIVFASLRSFQVLEQVGSFRFETENAPIIDASLHFVSISLPLLIGGASHRIIRKVLSL
jgi:hypothetical protein